MFTSPDPLTFGGFPLKKIQYHADSWSLSSESVATGPTPLARVIYKLEPDGALTVG